MAVDLEVGLVCPPAHLWVPEYAETDGDLAADLAASVSLNGRPMVMDPEQRLILDAALAVGSKPGVPACFEVAVIAPRQNLKTAVLQVLALTYLFVHRDPLVIWTAHLFKTTADAFQGMVKMIDSNPELSRLCKPPRTGNGDEAIELRAGGVIRFFARSKGATRGLTGSKVFMDEALFLSPGSMGALVPTMATIPGAQLLYGSSAGVMGSTVLRDVRDRGRAGGDPSLAYAEWAVPPSPCESDGCDHRRESTGCVLDDRALWWVSNPALSRGRITEDFIAKARRAMPPAEFAREFYGWWDEPEDLLELIDLSAWAAARVPPDAPGSEVVGRPAFGVEVSPDRSRAAIGVAGHRLGDARVQVEVVAWDRGTAWAVSWVAERAARLRPVAVVLDPSGPAGPLVADMRKALEPLGVELVLATPRDRAQAAGAMKAAVEELDPVTGVGGLAHLNEPVLNDAVKAVRKDETGDSWDFDRESPDADVTPLLAVRLAWHGLAKAGGPSVYEDRGMVVL